jgi:NAD(P)-dependent dehydrogenase (short-subunit alcohol dehydrogenase family)
MMLKFSSYGGRDKYATPDSVEESDDYDIEDFEEDDDDNEIDEEEVENNEQYEGDRNEERHPSYYYYDDSTVGNTTISTTLSMLKKVVSMNVQSSTSAEKSATTMPLASIATELETQQLKQQPPALEELTLRSLIKPGYTAVVTGASSGIGRAACLHFAKYGMNVFMVDIDAHDLAIAQKLCKETAAKSKTSSDVAVQQYILAEVVDVADSNAVDALAAQVFNATGGKCHILMNNAGIGLGGNSLTDMAIVERVMAVNTYGPIHGCMSFIPRMIKHNPEPGIVINTGSKQGITMPPGNLTYNMSKAALKVYTEGLEHELMLQRKAGLCNIRAVLLIPGWVNTSILLKSEREQAQLNGVDFDSNQTFFHEEKPATGAWMPSQIVDFMISELDNPEKFYVVCPDNDVDRYTDNLRITWTSQDIVQDRPPLSRWHPDYKHKFQDFLIENSKRKEEQHTEK